VFFYGPSHDINVASFGKGGDFATSEELHWHGKGKWVSKDCRIRRYQTWMSQEPYDCWSVLWPS